MSRKSLTFLILLAATVSTVHANDDVIIYGKPLNAIRYNIDLTNVSKSLDTFPPIADNDVNFGTTASDFSQGVEYGSTAVEAYGFHTLTTAYGGTYTALYAETINANTANASATAYSQYGFTLAQDCNVVINFLIAPVWQTETAGASESTYSTTTSFTFGDTDGNILESSTDANLTVSRFLAAGDYQFVAQTDSAVHAGNGTAISHLRVNSTYNISATPVPEPASMAALGLGLLGVARRRK